MYIHSASNIYSVRHNFFYCTSTLATARELREVAIYGPEYRGSLPCRGGYKESRNRPGVAQSVPGGLVSQIFMIFTT